ncbi:hypothetical protein [Sinorhizobium meliloti]|uniref:hypothetical protein n=1 Tax=Rhizobium meliloti TaxID=382 RepID=UPI00398D63C6
MNTNPGKWTGIVALCVILGAATPVPADEYYEGIDINQRTVDGVRQPINTYLLKGRAARNPDPGAKGTIPKQTPLPQKKTKTTVQP